MLVEVADQRSIAREDAPCRSSLKGHLKRFDFVDCLCRNSSDLPVESLDVSLRGRRMIEDSEIEWFAEGFWARQSRQTPDQLIKTGTHVVEGVTNGKTSVVGHIKKLALRNNASFVEIVISPHSVSLRSGESLSQNVQRAFKSSSPTKFK